MIMANNLFRFVVVRPPQRVDPEELDARTVRTHPAANAPTELLQDLLRLREAQDRVGMQRRSRDYIAPVTEQTTDFVGNLNDIETPIAAIDIWLLRHRRSLVFEDFKKFAEKVLNCPIPDAVTDHKYKADRNRVADSLLALNMAADANQAPAPHLTRAIRIFGLLERIAADEIAMAQPGAISNRLKATVLLPGNLYPLPAIESPLEQHELEAHRKRLEAYEQRQTEINCRTDRLEKLNTAIDQLVAAYEYDWRAVLSKQTSPVAPPEAATSPLSSVTLAPFEPICPFLSETARDQLSEDTRNLLCEAGISLDAILVPDAVTAIEAEISAIARDLYPANPASNVVLVGSSLLRHGYVRGTYHELEGLFEAIYYGPCSGAVIESPQSPAEPLPAGPGSIKPPNIGELFIIEQELQKYELGEIAHVENVLTGEFKERTHRRAQTTEEILFAETEVTEETERDLESTERFELQVEAQKVISEDTSLEAGLTVTGKYGWVEFTADTRYAYDTAKEESRRTASNYSRDVTDRAVSRVQERVLERRTRRMVQEFEETNIHRLDNTTKPTDHAVGIYRWIDKVYRCQLINYGQRAMFEFIIPQPASFLKYAISARPIEGGTLEKPEPPGHCHTSTSTFVPLHPDDIDPLKPDYLFWVAQYNVTGVEPPPPRYTIVSQAFHKEIQPKSPPEVDVHAHSDNSINVPDGYVAKRAWFAGMAFPPVANFFRVEVGNKTIIFGVDGSNFGGLRVVALDNREDEVIPVAIHADRVLSYAFTLEIECERTEAELQRWKLATFNAIMTAYRELQAQYDEQVAALQVQQGVDIQGRNPLVNRQVEQAELKRAAISILTDQHFDHIDALRKNVPKYGYPELDLAETAVEGPYIRFFEQAFEWENMTYLFYPYFWGRKEDWITDALLDDTDPLFAQFLRAGAARVVVPARPGFEAAICSYLSNGWPIPDEADPTCPDEDGGEVLPFLSIVDEMKAQQGYDATPGEGTVTVQQDSPNVTGTDTAFDKDRDTDREIHIAGAKYRITTVTSATDITLMKNYSGPSATGLSYALGVKYVGEPWEVRVPTSLVILQKDPALPQFS